MDSKVVVALVSVSLGWTLSQLTEFLREKRKTKKIREAFDAELEDMAIKLENAVKKCTDYRDNLTSENSSLYVAPQPIKTIIFENYFHEVYTLFSKYERNSLTTLYGHVDHLNKRLESMDGTNTVEDFANLYSSILWAQACIHQFQVDRNVHISEVTTEVERVNLELMQYWNTLERKLSC
ncbi:TPA: hypothetical protein ACN36J_004531 [Vibrio parahaemolyticus]|uniref:hypothetical protein n=1 Tax=Vibrio parahaemolyticus TaxID=670 RepID=UPI001123EA23|nr:hypothetical protein [Vibrio parahaemolyticus]TOA17850.1 hypothetical protein CGK32_23170 [Vibrio parahaemolyticus]